MTNQAYTIRETYSFHGRQLPAWQEEREKLPFLAFLVFIFIAVATGSAARFPWNYIVKISGAVLLAAFAIRWLTARIRLAPEVFLYLLWGIWSSAAMIAGANYALYVMSAGTVFQIWLLLVIIAGYTNNGRVLSFNLLAFLCGAAVVWLSGALSGSFESALEMQTRATGRSMDPNGFGWLMIVATVAMAYFWMLPTRWSMLKHATLATGMVSAAAAAVFSGSRFGILGMVLFYAVWLWFCYRGELFRRARVLLVAVLAASVGGFAFVSLIQRTTAGARLHETWLRLTGRTTTGGSAGRIEIYQEALSVIARHPLFGVGLNNFRLHSTHGAVAHSEFTEVAADTGIPGAMIYFTIYYLMWRRAGRIAKYSPDPGAVRIAKLVKAYLVVMLFIGLGAPHYYSKTAWIILGSFIGWSQAAWGKLREQIASSQWGHTRAYEGHAA